MHIPEYLTEWEAFDAYRKQVSKGKWTQSSKEFCIKKLERFHAEGMDVNEIIRTSIENSWTGLFPSKARRQPVLDNFNAKEYGKSGKI